MFASFKLRSRISKTVSQNTVANPNEAHILTEHLGILTGKDESHHAPQNKRERSKSEFFQQFPIQTHPWLGALRWGSRESAGLYVLPHGVVEDLVVPAHSGEGV